MKQDNTVKRSLQLPADGSEDRSQTSLRISELLRATFVELETTPGAPEEPDPPPANPPRKPPRKTEPIPELPPDDRPETTPESTRPILLEARGVVTAASFEQPPVAQLHLGAHFPFRGITGLEVFALVPLSWLKLKKPEGEVSIRKASLATGLRLTFFEGAGRLRSAVSAGIGLDTTFVQAKAAPGLTANSRAAMSALFYGRIQIAVSLSRRVSFVGESLLGTDIPRARITVVDKAAVTLSALILCGLLGINIVF